ncbi:uncharacterized protein LOC132275470 isoform X1 [Cornus florida]|uniref:uncharacterized protein LOC132275470 isoform X1 n=1 Tax=Cornus florida TaxID=4283 RepID=UPI00289E803F|nr:uncharacterized protein LOC132275470 isoform X1 [Cornus florida]
MEVVAVKTMFVHLGLCPKKILTKRQTVGVLIPTFSSKRACFSLQMRGTAKDFRQMASHKYFHAVRAVSSGLEDIAVSSFTQFEDFSVSTSTTKADELKITVVVSGAKTRAIFDNVFSKMVADAQPIPGFRRVKGGKTPNIPRDVLLEVLGPSKVYKQVIKKVINSTVAEYVEKEGITVGKDLRVGQSFEDLEAMFEPGNEFSFDAVVRRQ